MKQVKRTLSLFLAVCLLLSCVSVSAFAVSVSTKPANGTTKSQPFAPGTGGSQNFRIPGIVTLDDGTLIAACDARWNHSGDGAGLDTIVSVSTDNGENWTYTYANYLGDNGDTYNNLSTCFIDPGIGTDGETAYLIADLWPAGIALNTSRYSPVAGENGFDASGNLLLRALSEDTTAIGENGYNTMAANVSRYKFYLDLEKLTLHNADGTAISGYTVDAYFNIKSTDGTVDTNLFFSDSPYQPYPTDYLYMTTSTDGLNWSVPKLLNLQEDDEQTLLVGPGNGTYDEKNDRMIFTAYEHTSGYERTCLIWMDSQGNWYRTEDATGNVWSSEATSVVLDDGTVRVFYRDSYTTLRYTDYVFSESQNNYVVYARGDTSVAKDSGCQLTSIKYSEQIDGKDVILVAGPTSSRRINGYIYVFLVDEDNSMELAYAYNVTPEFYAYSCLTELEDGRIGLLYESAGSALTFVTYDFDKIANRDNDPTLTIKEVELLAGYDVTITDNSGYYVGSNTSELDPDVAEVSLTGEQTTTIAAQVLGTGANIDLDSCQYTFTKGTDGYYEVSATTLDGENVYLNHFSTTSNSIPNVTAPAGKIAILESAHENMFKLQAQVIEGSGSGSARGLHFHMEYDAPYWNRCGNDSSVKCHEYLYRKAAAGETASTEIPGYVRITAPDQIKDGGKYLIAAKNDSGNWFVLNPSTSTEKLNHVAQVMGITTVGSTELTFTGVAEGYTEVVIGSTIYKLSVYDVNEVTVNVTLNHTATVTETSGNYADAPNSGLDTSIATVTKSGIDGTMDNGLSLQPVSQLTDGTYVIVNTRANKLLTNAPVTAEAAAGAGAGLNMSGSISDEIADIAVWTITKVDGGYTLQDTNGKYMTIGSKTASVADQTATVSLDWSGSAWNLSQNGAYLNHFGGGSSTCAAGWVDGSAPGDAGSQFAIYSYTDQPYGPSTKLTFTGVTPGTTELLIGHTKFIIKVDADTTQYVTAAQEAAEEAQAAYEAAKAAAAEAQAAAEEAQTKADNAADSAVAQMAQDLADAAQAKADEAQAAAEAAKAAADTAATAAETAENAGTVAEAQAAAEAAATAAVTAQEKKAAAVIAATSAAAANESAGYAESAAEAAAAAAAAQKAAEQAKAEAETAKQEALDAQAKAEADKNNADAAKDAADKAAAAAEAAEAAAEAERLAAEEAKKASDDAAALAQAAKEAAEKNQLSAEEAQKAAAAAQKAAEEAQAAAEAEKKAAADAVVAAEQAEKAAKAAQAAAEAEKKAAEDALAKAEAEKKAAEEALAKAEAAEKAAAEKELAAEKAMAALELDQFAAQMDTDGFTEEQLKELTALVSETKTKLGDAKSVEEVKEILEAVLADLEAMTPEVHDCPSKGFSDVKESGWYHEYVDFMVENKYMNGVSDTKFDVNGSVTRAQLVTILYRLAGEPSVEGLENPFTDVPEGKWFSNAVIWAASEEVVMGVSATEFKPNDAITRQQIVTILYRYEGAEAPEKDNLTAFKDADKIANYAKDAMNWAVGNGIISGMDDVTLAPAETATRAQICAIVMRYLEK